MLKSILWDLISEIQVGSHFAISSVHFVFVNFLLF